MALSPQLRNGLTGRWVPDKTPVHLQILDERGVVDPAGSIQETSGSPPAEEHGSV